MICIAYFYFYFIIFFILALTGEGGLKSAGVWVKNQLLKNESSE